MLLGGIAALAAALAAALCVLGGSFGNGSWMWKLPVYFLGLDLGLLLAAFGVLAALCACVDLNKPQEKDDKFYRGMAYLYIDALLTIGGVRLHTQGLERLPKGRFLLVCNHLNLADPAVLLACFKKNELTFISKQENRKLPIAGPVMHKIRSQMIDRDNDRQSLRAIIQCVRMLQADEVSVCVFPEGTRSRDGKLHHFRPGAFKIAQKARVPVVVCTLRNTDKLFANLARLKPTHVHLHLVGVLEPDQQGAHTTDISRQVRQLMLEDLGFHLDAPEEEEK